MEAKDTVKSYGELKAYCFDKGISEPEELDLRKAQADISFKAGYRLGLYDKLDSDDEGYGAGKKTGIREVVEWLQANSPFLIAGQDVFAESAGNSMKQEISYYPNIKLVDWQAKLKEWGMND